MKLLVSLVFLFYFCGSSSSSRILGFFPVHSQSHLIIHAAIAETLAERGHNVTVVSNLRPLEQNLPYRFVKLDVPSIRKDIFSKAIDKRPWPYFITFNAFILEVNEIGNASLNHPSMQKLMREESFDLVLLGYFMNDFLFGVAAHFKCPLILSFTMRPFLSVHDLIGNPDEFAYVPTLAARAKQPMSFLERVRSYVSVRVIGQLGYRLFMTYIHERFYRANFPSDMYPTLGTMMRNVSLLMVAHHFSQGPIRPDVPALVEIGGIQIKEKPDPLPEDIKTILDSSTNYGAIYFSLGTNIQQMHLNPIKLRIMFEVLSKLPQTILCKWSDDKVPLESPNIFYKKWLPQDDVLAHPNVKLFITHGGLGGVVEAQYHGVPMVGIPFFNDQHVNMYNVRDSGSGLILDHTVLSNQSFRSTIENVLYNKSYALNVKRFSRLYRDRPMTAKQTAAFWVEYVIRHRGAPHMQSPAVHMYSFQLMSLDVIGFLLFVFYIVFKAFKMVCLFVKRRFVSSKLKKA